MSSVSQLHSTAQVSTSKPIPDVFQPFTCCDFHAHVFAELQNSCSNSLFLLYLEPEHGMQNNFSCLHTFRFKQSHPLSAIAMLMSVQEQDDLAWKLPYCSTSSLRMVCKTILSYPLHTFEFQLSIALFPTAILISLHEGTAPARALILIHYQSQAHVRPVQVHSASLPE